MFASFEVDSWEGEEWALESAPNDETLAWAGANDPRTPFAWLRACHRDGNSVVTIYQDDAVFGLCFNSDWKPELPAQDTGSLRTRRDIPLVRGSINQVEVVYDTVVEGGRVPGLVTELLLHGATDSTMLIAAGAHSRTEWHLYEESVVALRSPDVARDLEWIPQREDWTPTEGG